MSGSRHLGAALGLGLFVLAGCSVGPDYAPPKPVSSAALQSGKFLRSAAEQTNAVPAARWWETLDDPVLTALIDRGLAQAPTMTAAEARVRQARQGLRGLRASQLPSVNPSITYVHAELPGQAFGTGSGGTDIFNVGFDANWEIDIWGAKRRKVEKSKAEVETSEARFADAQVSLSAEIARTYVELREAQASLALLGDKLELETHLADLAQQRFDRGATPREAVEGALDIVAESRREQIDAEARTVILRDALAVLTGQAPGALDGMPQAAVPLPPATVPVGNPAALLARRPDVRAADRAFAAATAQIGVEDAKRFPTVSLLGLVGIGGNAVDDLFDSSKLTAIAIPRLSWKFLDFGQIAAAKRGAEGARDAALADWQQSVLSALQDAEAALTRFGAARQEFILAHEHLDRASHVADLARQRALTGAASDGEAVAAQSRVDEAELTANTRRAELTLSYVTLAKSLGLGWQAQPAIALSTAGRP